MREADPPGSAHTTAPVSASPPASAPAAALTPVAAFASVIPSSPQLGNDAVGATTITPQSSPTPGSSGQPVARGANANAQVTPTRMIGIKRKCEPTEAHPIFNLQAHPSASPLSHRSFVPNRLPDELAAAMAERPNLSGIRIAIEFSLPSDTLMRATWIASEMITEFRPHIIDVNLIPRATEHTFNIWINGNIAWSRGVGQPLPDYDHLRPLFRAKCSTLSG